MNNKPLKCYELYCDGCLIGSCLYYYEVKEMKREYIKNYAEMHRIPKFRVVEI